MSEESPAAKAARLRRERRQAKISADPNSRMEKITGHRVVSESMAPVPKPSRQPSSPSAHGDPPEMELSEHHYYPQTTPRPPMPTVTAEDPLSLPSELDMNAMMAQHPLFANLPRGGASMPGAGGSKSPGGGETPEDPMLEMLRRMGMSGEGGIPGLQPPEAFPTESVGQALLWRLLHFFGMLLIAFMSVREVSWAGRDSDRLMISSGSGTSNLFYLFAATELGLQSARFILEKGRLQGSGLLKFLSEVLPPPWGGYVGTVARYNIIFATILRDAAVLLFWLGVCGWWRS